MKKYRFIFHKLPKMSWKSSTFTDKLRQITYQEMKRATILTSFLTCALAVSAQTMVSTYTPGVSAEGAAYYLPKTAINVHVAVEKTMYMPGELCQYAERYLRVNGISDKEDLHYQIKSVTIEPVGLPDTEKLYYIAFDSKTVAPLVELNPEGVLLAVNTTNTYVAGTASASVVDEVNTLNPRSYMTEEMLMTGSKAKLAELVAKEIYNIRESRNLMLRGQNENMPKDGEGLQIIIDNTKEQEEALMQLFVGVTTTECTTHTFQILPDGEADRLLFGRFSRKLGVLHKDDLGGSPLYIDVKSRNMVPMVPVDSVSGKGKKKKLVEVKKAEKQDGVVYNLPEKAAVKVYTNATTLAEQYISIAQLGNTETLSKKLFTKREDVKVTLDPTNGALLKIEE